MSVSQEKSVYLRNPPSLFSFHECCMLKLKKVERNMEEEVMKVCLHGMWGSIFVKRVEMALKMKGIPYDYVEEDLRNKSEQLLHYNPVHKKVPVLVHEGQPISESLVILEYIDENWRHPPFLLPQDDPLQRSRVRFWASFIHQQVFDSLRKRFMHEGEEQRKHQEELFSKLDVLEVGIERDFFSAGATPFTGGKTPGLVDIVMCSIFCIHKATEETSGSKIIDPRRNPLLFSWVTALSELSVVKEIIPPHEQFVALLKQAREKALQSKNREEALQHLKA